jgi:enoyl-CoA hydratase
MSDAKMKFDPAAYEGVRYEQPAPEIVNIVMARPEVRNAQNMAMTYALNHAFNRAAHDDAVRVILLSGEGPHFSTGHDMGGDRGMTWRDFDTVGTWNGFDEKGVEALYGREKEIYFDMCERWRNIPKPTIAVVQGSCIAGGLMLVWACDMIIAAENARFRDPTLEFGVSGVEFFMHPWEIGARKAKEWLLTSDWLTAQEACALGMVNRVVPEAKLLDEAMTMARKIATKSTFAVKAAKEAVNHAQDVMGRRNAMMHAFGLHHLSHNHNKLQWGTLFDVNGVHPTVRQRVEARFNAPSPPEKEDADKND